MTAWFCTHSCCSHMANHIQNILCYCSDYMTAFPFWKKGNRAWSAWAHWGTGEYTDPAVSFPTQARRLCKSRPHSLTCCCATLFCLERSSMTRPRSCQISFLQRSSLLDSISENRNFLQDQSKEVLTSRKLQRTFRSAQLMLIQMQRWIRIIIHKLEKGKCVPVKRLYFYCNFD